MANKRVGYRDPNIKTRYCQYQGKSERVKEFLSYGRKESSIETNMRELGIFENFIKQDYNTDLDSLFTKLETNQLDVYRFCAKYLNYLKKLGNEPSTIKNRISTAKSLILTTTRPTVSIEPKKFKSFVKLPTIIKKQKRGLDKETTIKLINSCVDNPRLRMLIFFLAATSCRIGETLLLRIKDLHLNGEPKFGLRPPFLPYISIRGETTKTEQDRTVLLTSEITEQLKLWVSNKYRIRNKVTTSNGKTITEKYKPEMHKDDYLFMDIDHNYNETDAARFVYRNLTNELHKVLINSGLDDRTKKKLYAISFHKIRMGVRTRISDLGFKESKEFGDFYMGHDTSTYYNPSDDDYKKNFLLCQNELTYLDQTQIQKSYGEIETRIDKIEDTEIAVLNKRLAQMEQDRKVDKERINELLVHMAKSMGSESLITKNMKTGETTLTHIDVDKNDTYTHSKEESLKVLDYVAKRMPKNKKK